MALPPGALTMPFPPAAAGSLSVDHARPRLPLVLPRNLIQTIPTPLIGAAVLVARGGGRRGFYTTCGADFGSPRHVSAGDAVRRRLSQPGW